jgi:hypothetical protein
MQKLKVNYHIHKTLPEEVHIPATTPQFTIYNPSTYTLQFTIYNPSIYTKNTQGYHLSLGFPFKLWYTFLILLQANSWN